MKICAFVIRFGETDHEKVVGFGYSLRPMHGRNFLEISLPSLHGLLGKSEYSILAVLFRSLAKMH